MWRWLLEMWRENRPSPYHCDECRRPVPIGEGIRDGRTVWCSDEHARIGVDRMQW